MVDATFSLSGLSPPDVPAEAARAIAALLAGRHAMDLESETLDFKEDASLRGAHGDPIAGEPRSDAVAADLADAAACLANHEGGVIVVGIDERAAGEAALRGTVADRVWLQSRIRELTVPPLAVTAQEASVRERRLLVIECPRNTSAEPHSAMVSRRGGRRTPRRVGTQCQDMTRLAEMVAWSEGRIGADWSAAPSRIDAGMVTAIAMEELRRFLRETFETDRSRLAELDDHDLLARLQLLRADGSLTNAGALLLTPGAAPRLVYRARSSPGARSTHRVERADHGLLHEFALVEQAIDVRNRVHELPQRGSVIPEVRAIPPVVVREAIVNALMHRDWRIPEPVVVDHMDDELTVFSPGGLFEISIERILSAPSRTRNRTLADVFRSLRLAEREGTGVDRMYIEQIRIGHAPPLIQERDGGVRVTIVGGAPNAAIASAYGSLPDSMRESARAAVALSLLRTQPSITLDDLATVAQEPADGLRAFAAQAEEAGLLTPTAHPRPDGERAWRLADPIRETLGPVLPYFSRPASESIALIVNLARQTGIVRNQDVQDLLGLSSNRASGLLRQATEDGVLRLAPGSSGRGRATAYVPTGPASRSSRD